MNNKSTSSKTTPLKLAAVAIAAALVASLGLASVIERKQEAKKTSGRVVELDDRTQDPAVWGKNFPIQYEDFMRTVEQVPTRYGGSKAVPRTPTDADPRSVVAQSKLEEDPRLKRMWAGGAFARDFREDRGHEFMLVDQKNTGRQGVPQPGTCLNCHASTYTAHVAAGGGDLIKGFEIVNQMPFAEAVKLVEHPMTCIDCHDPKTMELRITRPALIEGMRALKASEGIPDYDVNLLATRQEMRSMVCAQCHVEYYFKGPERRLVFPWAGGIEVESQLAHYDTYGFRDFIHAETGAPILKVQHPEFELWAQGIHARSDVSCADCHMPEKHVGALKVSDHHIRSPLLNINNACLTCHGWPEEEMRQRVETIQTRTHRLRDLAMDALMDLITDIKAAIDSGASDASLAEARDFQRKATFYLDFVEAENSTGFHAPQEAARILGESIDFSRRGQNSLRGIARPASTAFQPPPPLRATE